MKYYFYRLYKTLLLTLLCMLIWNPLMADRDNQHQSKSMRGFSVHDSNKDGLLSREEYHLFFQHHKNRKHKKGRPVSLHSFEEVDKNQDGFIDEDELIFKLNRHLQQHRRYRYREGATKEQAE